MMGTTKLSEVRKGLREAFAKAGHDPIQWLDDRIAELQRAGKSKNDGPEVYQALRRLLKTTTTTRKRRARKAIAKK
jgi:hypothetical protein